MPWSQTPAVASLGGAGVRTLGGELASLDSAGADRNVLDDGSGNLTVGGNVSAGAEVIGNNLLTYPTAVAQPAVPASGVALNSPVGVDAMVYITGGTVTAVAINGVATGLTSGGFYVATGDSITLTYTVAPTWVWRGV